VSDTSKEEAAAKKGSIINQWGKLKNTFNHAEENFA